MDPSDHDPQPPSPTGAADPPPPPPRSPLRVVLYPNCYVWYVFLASLDIMLTWVVLHVGGYEANFIANWVIHRWDLPGVVTYKFALVMVVIGICEIIGRREPNTGRKLAEWAVAISIIPVALTLGQFAMEMLR